MIVRLTVPRRLHRLLSYLTGLGYQTGQEIASVQVRHASPWPNANTWGAIMAEAVRYGIVTRLRDGVFALTQDGLDAQPAERHRTPAAQQRPPVAATTPPVIPGAREATVAALLAAGTVTADEAADLLILVRPRPHPTGPHARFDASKPYHFDAWERWVIANNRRGALLKALGLEPGEAATVEVKGEVP